MTPEDHAALRRTLAASVKLDQFLSSVTDNKPMPEVGGKSLATDLRSKIAAARERAAELKISGAGAVTEFVTELATVEQGIKNIQAETLELRQLNNDLHGNNPPTGETQTNGKATP